MRSASGVGAALVETARQPGDLAVELQILSYHEQRKSALQAVPRSGKSASA